MPIWRDPDLASVEALAQRIVGKSTDPNVLEPARRVAEAQIDLCRVRSHRNRLIERAMADPEFQTEAAEPAPFEPAAVRVSARIKGPSSDGRIQIIEATVSALVAQIAKNLAALDRSMRPEEPSLAKLTREIAALDRYERRALSQRKFAIREFDLAHLDVERRARDMGAASYGGAGEAD